MKKMQAGRQKGKIFAGILMLLCMGMLFALSVQAKSTLRKAVPSGKVRINKQKLMMQQDETRKLKLKNTSKKVIWSSSKESVASVNSRGLVKAKSTGVCTITAKAGRQKYYCEVKVYKPSSKALKANELRKKYKPSQNRNRIIVAGSSSIGRWESAATALRPYKVLNMGIGGSTIGRWLKWYKKLIVAYDPCAVILYPGVGNELRKTHSATKAGKQVCNFLKQLHRELPGVPIFYVSIYCNKNLLKIWPLEKSCNKVVKQYCSETDDLYYIDVASALINKNGNAPKSGVISDDGEHMNEKGYAIWNKTIAPIVKKKLKQAENKK